MKSTAFLVLLASPTVFADSSNVHITTTGDNFEMYISWSELLPAALSPEDLAKNISTVTYGYAGRLASEASDPTSERASNPL